MLSTSEIGSMQMKATVNAAARRLVPFIVWPGDAERIAHRSTDRSIPFLGKYVPRGWKPVVDENGEPITYFVDSSGFGREDERALTLKQFAGLLIEGHAYGIVEAGEFQVVIGEYERDGAI